MGITAPGISPNVDVSLRIERAEFDSFGPMANLFLNLPAPSANAAGAAVDVSGMGQLKTLVVGGAFDAQVTVEYATDDTGTNFAPIAGFGGPGHKTVEVAARWMRAVTSGYRGGAINVDVSGSGAGAEFVEVTGVSASIASLPAFKTVVVDGGFDGAVNIEISADGTSWAQVMTFQKGGGQSAVFVAQFVRATNSGGALPAIWMGAGNDGAGAGGDVPAPYPDPNTSVTIFATATGSDETGNGKTFATAYRTTQRAELDVAYFVARGVTVFIDATELGTGANAEVLPDGFELPSWKAPMGYVFNAAAPYWPIEAAVNIVADPRLASNIPAADALITAADLVPTLIGGGIVDVAAFNDVRADGVGGQITVEGGGIAKLTGAGADPEAGATLITIAGAGDPDNNGTFPVTSIDEFGDIFYENALAVEDLAYGGNWEAFVPFILVETAAPHGLWHTEESFQEVTIAGVLGSIGAVADGTFAPIWRTDTTFIYEIDTDATALVYGGAGTVSILFVQDPDSGNVQVKTNKVWVVDDLVGKLFISAESNFEHATIYHNTADTLFLTNCFAPGAFGGPITEFRIMEQSAELLTTCSFESGGSRRGPGRGGLTAANIDSLALGGIKVTPVNPGEIGLLQWGGTLVTQGCHLTTSRFTSAVSAAMSLFSYIDDAQFKGSAVDLDRCFYLNQPDPGFNGPEGWFYAYFGTVFQNVVLGFDTSVETDLFAAKFYEQGATAQFFAGKNTFQNVSFDNIDGFGCAASGSASRNRLERCGGTFTPGSPAVIAVNGGLFLINGNNGPYGDGSFMGAGDFMVVDGLPERTFEDWRQHALLDMQPLVQPTGGLFDSVFEAVFPWTSTPIPFFGDPPYPSIQTAAWAGPGVQVTDDLLTGVVLIEFVDGVSTVLDAETAVDATSTLIRTKTPGTPGSLLTAVADTVAATPLDLGVNGPCGEYTNIRPNSSPPYGPNSDPLLGSVGTQSTVLAYSLA